MLRFCTGYGPSGINHIDRFLEGFYIFAPEGPLTIYRNDVVPHLENTVALDGLTPMTVFRQMLHDKNDGWGSDHVKSAEKWFYKTLSIKLAVDAAALGDTVVWIDSDVTFKNGKPPHGWWGEVLAGPRREVATLLRPLKGHARGRAETGWVAVLIVPATKALFDDLLDVFLSGAVLTMNERNEAYILPRLMVDRNIRVFDIARKINHDAVNIHVWPHSPLGLFMDHHKGPRRKKEAYGC